MAEWLTHVLIAYALFTVGSWYIDWLDKRWVAVGMIGAVIPDLSRFELFIPADVITFLLGVPFDWSVLHTLGGTLVLSVLGAMVFRTRRDQIRGFALLLSAGISHLIVDLPQAYADGLMLSRSYAYPLPFPRVPTPGWYVSADRLVVLVAGVVAAVVLVADWYRGRKHVAAG